MAIRTFKENKNSYLQALLDIHAQHARHIENERTGLLFAYIASASTMVFLICTQIAEKIGGQAVNFLYAPIALSITALLITIRWNTAFDHHKKTIDKIMKRVGYSEYPMAVKANCFFTIFRTKYLFVLFYLVMIFFLSFLIAAMYTGTVTFNG